MNSTQQPGHAGEGPVTVLDDAESWELLGSSTLGRLALSVRNVPEIFPVNYYADGSSILFRTAEGTKLLALTINSTVAFEADGASETQAWSVVAKGAAHALESQREILEADATPLSPWIPTLKYVYVRIVPTELSGRRFVRAPEPERY